MHVLNIVLVFSIVIMFSASIITFTLIRVREYLFATDWDRAIAVCIRGEAFAGGDNSRWGGGVRMVYFENQPPFRILIWPYFTGMP